MKFTLFINLILVYPTFATSFTGSTDIRFVFNSFAGTNIPDGTTNDSSRTCQVHKEFSPDGQTLKIYVGQADTPYAKLPSVMLNLKTTRILRSNITFTSSMPIEADLQNNFNGAVSKESISVDYNDDARSDIVSIVVNGRKSSCNLLIEE